MLTQKKILLLIAVCVVATVSMFFISAIPQDPAYHNFADQRTLFDVPNFFNVVSNLPYMLFGFVGMHFLFVEIRIAYLNTIKHVYWLFYIGVMLVCLGSGYYHLDPSNETLVWDRLPMTISFMSFFVIVFAEHVHVLIARRMFWPLIAVGLFSVMYWHWTETMGQGDLRLYALIQFLPMLLIPMILIMFRCQFSHASYYWMVILVYIMAKLFELEDKVIFDSLQFISGHSLKHIISSLAPFIIYFMLKRRRKLAEI